MIHSQMPTGPKGFERGAQRLVLIVDDIEENRLLLDRVLKSGGYATIQASSGREALSILSRQTPDMVLLDWMMPDFSGLDVLRAIREIHPKTRLPVIMCTAIDEEEAVVTALAEGANDYMTKPISLAILRARMKTHLEQQDVIDTLDSEKAEAERRLGEQTRALFSGFGDRKDTDRR
jgi:DNA-binding response OmpR family regulator